jgi:putative membrane protein
MSCERTLMSWMRTATALIGFGFTIFQFFERMNQTPGVAGPRYANAPITLALAMIGVGTLGLVMAVLYYRRMLQYLWSKEFADFAGVDDRQQTTPTVYTACLLAFIGAVTFFTLLWRIAMH